MRRPDASYIKRAALAALLAAVTACMLLSVPAVSRLLFDHLQVYEPLSPSQLPMLGNGMPTAIVILSAGVRERAAEYGGDTVDAIALERVRYGAFVARHTQLPVLVSGGAARPGHPSLAALLAGALAQDYGIQPKWLEESSNTTAENAIYSARLLKENGIRQVVLVTHAWHMERARAAFVANGLSVIPAPTAFYRPTGISPTQTAFRMSGYALHEMLGSVWYTLRYGY